MPSVKMIVRKFNFVKKKNVMQQKIVITLHLEYMICFAFWQSLSIFDTQYEQKPLILSTNASKKVLKTLC